MPRTPSPAAAAGLPETSLSRRAMLGRIPAAALATTVILPIEAMACDDAGHVARLLDIEARLIAIRAQIAAQHEANYECERVCRRSAGKYLPPAAGESPRENYYWWHHHRRWKARHDKAIDASGLAAGHARLRELRDQQDEIADEVWSVKATTMRAFKIKARMLELTNYAAFSLAQDIIDLPDLGRA